MLQRLRITIAQNSG